MSLGFRHPFLAVLVASVVVVAMAAPAEATPTIAAAAAVKASTPVTIPAIGAHSVSQPKSSEPQGDFSTHSVTVPAPKVVTKPATTFDTASATVTSRSDYSVTSTDAHGLKETVVSDAPVNVKVGSSWVPSQTTLSPLPGGKLGDDTHPLHPQFGASANASSVLHVARDGATLDFALHGASTAQVKHVAAPKLDQFMTNPADRSGDSVSYANALPNTTVTYQVQTGGVKESIILAAAPATAPTYTWTVAETGDVSAVTDKLGDLDFVKADGTTVFSLPAPDMWDSSAKGGEKGGQIQAVAWNVQKADASTWQITLSPSFAWLTDPARVFPVTVDPDVNPSADSPIHSYKSDGNYNNGHALLGFNAQSGGCCSWRASVVCASVSTPCFAATRSTSRKTARFCMSPYERPRALPLSWTAKMSCRKYTPSSIKWPRSPTGSARESGQATPECRSGTSSISASAVPTSGRSWPTRL